MCGGSGVKTNREIQTNEVIQRRAQKNGPSCIIFGCLCYRVCLVQADALSVFSEKEKSDGVRTGMGADGRADIMNQKVVDSKAFADLV